MSNTYTSTRAAASATAKYAPTGVFVDTATFTTTSAEAVSVGDVIQMIKVAGADSPKGITILDIILYSTAAGTGTANVGDLTTNNWAMATQNIGAGGVFRLGAGITPTTTTGTPVTYTTDAVIAIEIAANTGNIVGTFTLVVLMTADPLGV